MVKVINYQQSVPVDALPTLLDKNAGGGFAKHNFGRFDNSLRKDLDGGGKNCE